MKKIGVFLIRGAGKSDMHEQRKFVDKLNADLRKSGVDPDQICYEYADWYGPTQDNQEKLLDRFLEKGYTNMGSALRRFILFLVSDIVAYTGEPNKPGSSYHRTHEELHKSFLRMKDALGEGSPLIIIASSLGTEIISNYIYDRQKATGADPLGGSAFERFETLTGIFMFGNINPVYITAYDIERAEPFRFPPEGLPERLKPMAYWGNYFDRNDPLGFPLKPVNEFYNMRVTEDIETNAGGLLFSWNAGSHLGYWKSRTIRKKIAAYIRTLLAQC
jgi:hypothetical protein